MYYCLTEKVSGAEIFIDASKAKVAFDIMRARVIEAKAKERAEALKSVTEGYPCEHCVDLITCDYLDVQQKRNGKFVCRKFRPTRNGGWNPTHYEVSKPAPNCFVIDDKQGDGLEFWPDQGVPKDAPNQIPSKALQARYEREVSTFKPITWINLLQTISVYYLIRDWEKDPTGHTFRAVEPGQVETTPEKLYRALSSHALKEFMKLSPGLMERINAGMSLAIIGLCFFVVFLFYSAATGR